MVQSSSRSRAFMLALAACATIGLSQTASAVPVAAPGTEGFDVVVATTGDVIAIYEGNSAAFSSDLYLNGNPALIFNNQTTPVGTMVNLGSFTAGTILTFRLHVNNTNTDFFTGPAALNPDNIAHARVQANYLPGVSLVSFEDRVAGEFDYDDLSFSFTNTGTDTLTPIGSAALMFAGGIAFGGFMLRRSKAAKRARRR
jgi:hypothetical protein